MSYILVLLLLGGIMLGLVALASNPSPYFSALGLVAVAGVGCMLLCHYGATFLSLVLFLIYLGGMLVVFAYTAALAADPHPEGWGDVVVASNAGGYTIIIIILACMGIAWGEYSGIFVEELFELLPLRADVAGVALFYSEGGPMLAGSGVALLLCLFVVLELTRGLARGALRAV